MHRFKAYLLCVLSLALMGQGQSGNVPGAAQGITVDRRPFGTLDCENENNVQKCLEDIDQRIGVLSGSSAVIGLTADTGGTTTGNVVDIAGGANITTSRSGDTITIDGAAGSGGTVDDLTADVGGATTAANLTVAGGDGIQTTQSGGTTVTWDITLGTTDGAGDTSSPSGLELMTGGFGLLQGCADNQILLWDEGTSTWACANESGGSPSFDAITGGTNLSETLVVGDGSTLSPLGTGIILANLVAVNAITNPSAFATSLCAADEILERQAGAWACIASPAVGDCSGPVCFDQATASGTELWSNASLVLNIDEDNNFDSHSFSVVNGTDQNVFRVIEDGRTKIWLESNETDAIAIDQLGTDHGADFTIEVVPSLSTGGESIIRFDMAVDTTDGGGTGFTGNYILMADPDLDGAGGLQDSGLFFGDTIFNEMHFDLGTGGEYYTSQLKCPSGDFITSDVTTGMWSCDTPTATPGNALGLDSGEANELNFIQYDATPGLWYLDLDGDVGGGYEIWDPVVAQSYVMDGVQLHSPRIEVVDADDDGDIMDDVQSALDTLNTGGATLLLPCGNFQPTGGGGSLPVTVDVPGVEIRGCGSAGLDSTSQTASAYKNMTRIRFNGGNPQTETFFIFTENANGFILRDLMLKHDFAQAGTIGVQIGGDTACDDNFSTGGPPQTGGGSDGLCDRDASTPVADGQWGAVGDWLIDNVWIQADPDATKCTDLFDGSTGGGTCPGTMTGDQTGGGPDDYCDDFSAWGSCEIAQVGETCASDQDGDGADQGKHCLGTGILNDGGLSGTIQNSKIQGWNYGIHSRRTSGVSASRSNAMFYHGNSMRGNHAGYYCDDDPAGEGASRGALWEGNTIEGNLIGVHLDGECRGQVFVGNWFENSTGEECGAAKDCAVSEPTNQCAQVKFSGNARSMWQGNKFGACLPCEQVGTTPGLTCGHMIFADNTATGEHRFLDGNSVNGTHDLDGGTFHIAHGDTNSYATDEANGGWEVSGTAIVHGAGDGIMSTTCTTETSSHGNLCTHPTTNQTWRCDGGADLICSGEDWVEDDTKGYISYNSGTSQLEFNNAANGYKFDGPIEWTSDGNGARLELDFNETDAVVTQDKWALYALENGLNESFYYANRTLSCTDSSDGSTTGGTCPGSMTANQTGGSADGYCDSFDTHGACHLVVDRQRITGTRDNLVVERYLIGTPSTSGAPGTWGGAKCLTNTSGWNTSFHWCNDANTAHTGPENSEMRIEEVTFELHTTLADATPASEAQCTVFFITGDSPWNGTNCNLSHQDACTGFDFTPLMHVGTDATAAGSYAVLDTQGETFTFRDFDGDTDVNDVDLVADEWWTIMIDRRNECSAAATNPGAPCHVDADCPSGVCSVLPATNGPTDCAEFPKITATVKYSTYSNEISP